jgi:hypothetical protein
MSRIWRGFKTKLTVDWMNCYARANVSAIWSKQYRI